MTRPKPKPAPLEVVAYHPGTPRTDVRPFSERPTYDPCPKCLSRYGYEPLWDSVDGVLDWICKQCRYVYRRTHGNDADPKAKRGAA